MATSEFLLPVQAIHKLGKGKKKLKPLAGTEREKSSSFLTEIPTHPPAPSDAALAAEVAAETNTMLVTGQIAAAKTTTVEVVPAEMKAEVSSVEHRETGDEAMSAPAPAADEVDLTALSSTPAYAHTDDQEAVVEKEAPDASTHTDVDLDMGESSSTSTGLPLPSDSLKLNLKTGGGGAGLSVAQQKRGLAAAEAHLAAEASEISTEVSSPPPRRVRRTMTAASVMMVGETLWAERKALADAAEARMKAERLERMKRELEQIEANAGDIGYRPISVAGGRASGMRNFAHVTTAGAGFSGPMAGDEGGMAGVGVAEDTEGGAWAGAGGVQADMMAAMASMVQAQAEAAEQGATYRPERQGLVGVRDMDVVTDASDHPLGSIPTQHDVDVDGGTNTTTTAEGGLPTSSVTTTTTAMAAAPMMPTQTRPNFIGFRSADAPQAAFGAPAQGFITAEQIEPLISLDDALEYVQEYGPMASESILYLNVLGLPELPVYDPYELRVVPKQNINPRHYVTVTSNGIVRHFPGYTEIQTSGDFYRHKSLCNMLRQINFFQKFSLIRAFRHWRAAARMEAFRRTRSELATKLFLVKPAYQESLYLLMEQYHDLAETKLTSGIYASDILGAVRRRRTLTEFVDQTYEAAMQERKRAEELVGAVVRTLEDTYQFIVENDTRATDQVNIDKKGHRKEGGSLYKAKEARKERQRILKQTRGDLELFPRLVMLADQMTMSASVTACLLAGQALLRLLHSQKFVSPSGYLGIIQCATELIDNQVHVIPSLETLSQGLLRVRSFALETLAKLPRPRYVKDMAHVFHEEESDDLWDESTVRAMNRMRKHGSTAVAIAPETFAANHKNWKATEEASLNVLRETSASCAEDADLFSSKLEMDAFLRRVEEDAEYVGSLNHEEDVTACIVRLRTWVRGCEEIQLSMIYGPVWLDLGTLRNNLVARAKVAHDKLLQRNVELCHNQLDESHSELKKVIEHAQRRPKNVVQFTNFVVDFKAGEARFIEFESRVALVDKSYMQLLANSGLDHLDDVAPIDDMMLRKELKRLWGEYLPEMEAAKAFIDANQGLMSAQVDTATEKLETRLREMIKLLGLPPYADPASDAATVERKLGDVEQELTDLTAQAHQVYHLATSLSQEVDGRGEELLNEAIGVLDMRQHLWNFMKLFRDNRLKWDHCFIYQLDLDDIIDNLDDMVREAYRLTKLYANDPVSQALVGEIDSFSSSQPLLELCASKDLRGRHWKQILLLVGYEIALDHKDQPTMDNCSMADVREMGVGHPDILSQCEDIKIRAAKESALERALERMRSELTVFKLNMVPYRDQEGAFKLGAIDDVQSLLDEQVAATQSILASPFSVDFRTSAHEWEKHLLVLQDMLDIWVSVQRMWIYLEPIFQSSDINAALSEEATIFHGINQQFQAVCQQAAFASISMLHIKKRKRCIEVSELFHRAHGQLEVVHKALVQYLDRKRMVFPRFYFLSDDEMLEILSMSRHPSMVEPHLKKCFEGIHKLNFMVNPKGGSRDIMITAAYSGMGEVLPFERPVLPREAQGAVERWLMQLEATMFENTKIQSSRCLADPLHSSDFGAWVSKWPQMCVLMATSMRWTRDVERSLTEKTVRDYEGTCQGDLDTLVRHVRGTLPDLTRLTLSTLLVQTVHARDIVDMLANKGEESDQTVTDASFEWQSQLRTYLEEPPLGSPWVVAGAARGADGTMEARPSKWAKKLPDNKSTATALKQAPAPTSLGQRRTAQEPGVSAMIAGSEVAIRLDPDSEAADGLSVRMRMLDADMEYGYEYLGNSARLVMTPLTDRCYQTLMMAYRLNLGGAPEGPAGTGKTETSKDLAKAVAKQCVVFNCSEALDYKSLAKFFKGLCATGSWVCFDEFNRMTLEVLSVTAQQIATIQTAIAQKSFAFEFEGTTLQLKLSAWVAVTMNPTYAGRNELPDNLKARFRSIAMMVPDYSKICEIVLFSEGFRHARACALKITQCFKLCSELLSAQDHYDYGMRAHIAVLRAAGKLKRDLTGPDDEFAFTLRALLDVNLCKFVASDISLFQGIAVDLFPDTLPRTSDYQVLRWALQEACVLRGLQATPYFVTKCIQLHEMLSVRHGLMLVGHPMAGKTSTYRILAHAWTLIASDESLKDESSVDGFTNVSTAVINPKSMSIDRLYGRVDRTGEWSEGCLSQWFRDASRKFPESTEAHWVVMDGPVDAHWIENMNSVLDDNKKLCLASGEVIRMSDPMRMLFEVADLQHASPATVSRCGMVYNDPNALGWRLMVLTWVDSIEHDYLEDAHRAALLGLVNVYLPTVLDFMAREIKTLVQVSSGQLVGSMLFLMKAQLARSNNSTWWHNHGRHMVEFIENIFLQALIWAMGGVCATEEDRMVLTEFLVSLTYQELAYYRSPSGTAYADAVTAGNVLDWRVVLGTDKQAQENRSESRLGVQRTLAASPSRSFQVLDTEKTRRARKDGRVNPPHKTTFGGPNADLDNSQSYAESFLDDDDSYVAGGLGSPTVTTSGRDHKTPSRVTSRSPGPGLAGESPGPDGRPPLPLKKMTRKMSIRKHRTEVMQNPEEAVKLLVAEELEAKDAESRASRSTRATPVRSTSTGGRRPSSARMRIAASEAEMQSLDNSRPRSLVTPVDENEEEIDEGVVADADAYMLNSETSRVSFVTNQDSLTDMVQSRMGSPDVIPKLPSQNSRAFVEKEKSKSKLFSHSSADAHGSSMKRLEALLQFPDTTVKRFSIEPFPRAVLRKVSIMNFYLSYTTSEAGDWKQFDDKVVAPTIPRDTALRPNFRDLTVPTPNRAMYLLVLDLCVQQGVPLLFVGPSGVGKSMYMDGALSELDTEAFAPHAAMSFTAQSTAANTQAYLVANLTKRRRGVLAPQVGKRMVIMLDDLSMPKREEFGAQPPLELIRTILDHKTVYQADQSVAQLVDVNLVGAMVAPGGGRLPIPPRLARHFVTQTMVQMTPESMQRIFEAKVMSFLNTHPDSPEINQVKVRAGAFVSATIAVHNACLEKLMPTPRKSHYAFSVREVMRVTQGLTLPDPEKLNDLQVVRLWAHECRRVYGDRLLDVAELTWLQNTISAASEKHFKTRLQAAYHVLVPNIREEEALEQVVWSGCTRPPKKASMYSQMTGVSDDQARIDAGLQRTTLYEESLTDTLAMEALQHGLAEYKVANPKSPLNLTVFGYAIQHVARISRVLRLPREHLMLVGVGGTGRKSLARLAAFLEHNVYVEPSPMRNYQLSDWVEEVKGILMSAGAKGRRTTMLMSDESFRFEEQYVHISALLQTGDVRDILGADDVVELLDEMSKNVAVEDSAARVRNAAQATIQVMEEKNSAMQQSRAQPGDDRAESAPGGLRSIDMSKVVVSGDDSPLVQWQQFVGRVRKNLHIIICFRQEGVDVRLRQTVRDFPAFISRCQLDWYHDWPLPALEAIGIFSLANVEVPSAVSGGPEDLKKVITMCMTLHDSAQRLRDVMLHESGRHCIVTPKMYITLFEEIKRLLLSQAQKLSLAYDRYKHGVDELAFAEKHIDTLREEMEDLRPRLEEATRLAAEKLAMAEEERLRAQTTREMVDLEVEKANEVAMRAEAIRKECEEHLMLALPEMEAAISALDTINPKDMRIVQTFKNPPEPIKVVLMAVMALLKVQPHVTPDPKEFGKKIVDYWSPALKMLQDDKLLQKLKSYEIDNIDPKVIAKVKSEYSSNENFNPERVSKASEAVAGICKWVLALVKYDEVARQIAPKRAALAEADAQFRTSSEILKKKQAELDEVEARLRALREQVAELEATKRQLEADMLECRVRTDRAQQLYTGLTSERHRWSAEMAKLAARLDTLLGDSVLAAGFINYLGTFNRPVRDRALAEWTETAATLGLAITRSRPVTPLERAATPQAPNPMPWQLEYQLSSPAEVGRWRQEGLPHDVLSAEGVLIADFVRSRAPLLVDPIGQVTKWFLGRKDTVMVMVDDPKLLKRAEYAVTSGFTLFVMGITDTIPQVLDPLVSRDTFTHGGETYVTLGDNAIKWLDSFRCVLHCGTQNARFTSEMASRMNIISFEVSEKGLSEQLVGLLLEHEEPELASDFHKLTQQRAVNEGKLVDLEDDILAAVTGADAATAAGQKKAVKKAPGSILDNEDAIKAVQHAQNVASEIKQANEVIIAGEVKIEEARQVYASLARFAAVMYFSVQDLAALNPMYLFSLDWYIAIFISAVEQAPHFDDGHARRAAIQAHHLRLTFDAVCMGLFARHKRLFALMMSLGVLRVGDALELELTSGQPRTSVQVVDNQRRFLFSDGQSVEPSQFETRSAPPPFLNKDAWINLCRLPVVASALEGLPQALLAAPDVWQHALSRPGLTVALARAPEDAGGTPSWTNMDNTMHLSNCSPLELVLVLRILVPHLVPAALEAIVADTMGPAFLDDPIYSMDQVFDVSQNLKPMLFLLAPGLDPLQRIYSYAERVNMRRYVTTVSLGQGQEGKVRAALEPAVRNGNWVVLQNVHLSPSFLPWLDQFVDNLKPGTTNSNFRLLLLSMPTPDIPSRLLRESLKVCNESRETVRDNMLRCLGREVLRERGVWDNPKEPPRDGPIHLLPRFVYALSLLHGVLKERSAYGPAGWCVPYKFSDGDFTVSLSHIRLLLSSPEGAGQAPGGGASPVALGAIRYLVGDINYGGRVTDQRDRVLLQIILDRIMPEALLLDDSATPLLTEDGPFYPPKLAGEVVPIEALEAMVRDIPNDVNPAWLGLHPDMAVSRQQREGRELLLTLSQVAVRSSSKNPAEIQKDEALARRLCVEFIDAMPDPLDADLANAKYPQDYDQSLNQVLLQEVGRYNRLRDHIMETTHALRTALDGQTLMTPILEDVYQSFVVGRVPQAWLAISYPTQRSLHSYFDDLKERLHEFRRWVCVAPPTVLLMSSFFFTHSLLTALRQNFARLYGLPIDEVFFDFCFMDQYDPLKEYKRPRDGAYLRGFTFECAKWAYGSPDQVGKEPSGGGSLVEADAGQLSTEAPVIWFKPVHRKPHNTTMTVVRKSKRPNHDEEGVDHGEEESDQKVESELVTPTGDADKRGPTYACPLYRTPQRQGVLLTTGHSTNFMLLVQVPCSRDAGHWTLRGTALLLESAE